MFNYWEDYGDREYGFNQTKSKRTYRQFSINDGTGWSEWKTKVNLRTMICHAKGITHKEAKKLNIEYEMKLLGYKVYAKSLPYITNYPKYEGEE
jgi:hypothetical protein